MDLFRVFTNLLEELKRCFRLLDTDCFLLGFCDLDTSTKQEKLRSSMHANKERQERIKTLLKDGRTEGRTCCCQTHLHSSSGCEPLAPAAGAAPWPRCGPASSALGRHFLSNLSTKKDVCERMKTIPH